jgi:hypothetical protein
VGWDLALPSSGHFHRTGSTETWMSTRHGQVRDFFLAAGEAGRGDDEG